MIAAEVSSQDDSIPSIISDMFRNYLYGFLALARNDYCRSQKYGFYPTFFIIFASWTKIRKPSHGKFLKYSG